MSCLMRALLPTEALMDAQKQTPGTSGGDFHERTSQLIAPSNIGSNPNSCQDLPQFRDATCARGLILPVDIVADGKVHRCGTSAKPKGTDAAYLLFKDGRGGGFQNHADGLGWEDWQADNGHAFTPAKQATFTKRIAAARKAREEEDARKRADAAELASKMWNTATPCEDHPYLTQKGVQPHGLRVLDSKLVVPLFAASGKLTSLQTIAPNGAKHFLSGGRKYGCYFILGTPAPGEVLGIAEGYATAATIHEATGYAVAVAFDCGNLRPVAKALKSAYPAYNLVIFADDDLSEGNPGQTKAKEAAAAAGCRAVHPGWGDNRPDGATDFNDLAQARGLDAVRLCIEARL